jgi:hypothetical protein
MSNECEHVRRHPLLQMASGILIYMGLVDLLATDIFSEHMRSQRTRFQAGCLAAVVLGATAMVRFPETSNPPRRCQDSWNVIGT